LAANCREKNTPIENTRETHAVPRDAGTVAGKHAGLKPGATREKELVYGCGLGFDGVDVDEAAVTALVDELDVASDEREERVVLALTDVFARLVFRAALTDDDGASIDELAPEALDAKPLTV